MIQFSDYALTNNNAMPTGTAVDNNSGMTVFGAVSTANGGKIELSYSPSDSLLLIAVKDSSGNILEQYRSWPEPTPMK